MPTRISVRLAAIARLSCLIAVAPRFVSGQWSEDFDSYPTGSAIVGRGSWTGWDEMPGIDADVSDETAASAPNSLRLRQDSDIVRAFRGVRGGVWVMRAKTFVPSDHEGASYFILLNKYTSGGPDDWSTEVVFDSGRVISIGGSNFGGGGSLPWNADRWIDLEIQIDFDANAQSISYGGALLDETPWQVSGIAEVQALDLYSGGGTPVYFDDFSLAPVEAGPRSMRSIATAGACPDPDPVTVSVRQPLAEGADPDELVAVSETVRGGFGRAQVDPANGGGAQDIFPVPVDGDGFIRAWLLLGPFTGHTGHDDPGCVEMERDFLTDGAVAETAVMPEAGQAIHTEFGGRAASTAVVGPEELNPGGVPTWNPHYDADDTIDFNADYYRGDINDVMMYAFTYVTAAEAVDVDLCIASDDAVEVLIDSVEVWCNSGSRKVGAAGTCLDRVPIGVLGQGEHKLMVKVFEGGAGHGFRFAFKLTETDEPAPGITACLKPAQAECRLPPVGARIAWNITREQLDRGIGYTVDVDRGPLEFKGDAGGFRTLGGTSALLCPAPTDSQGYITGSQFVALGPFTQRFGFSCQGEAPILLANHIANARIDEEYPSPGDAIDYDAAAAASTGYAGPLDASGSPYWRTFDDGREDGLQDMRAGLGNVEHAMGWLVTYIEYTGAAPAAIHVCFGSGDGGQLWWDCSLLASVSSCGRLTECTTRIEVEVKPGVHRIAAGAWDNTGNWGLSLRLLKSDVVTPIVAGDAEWRFAGDSRPGGFTPLKCGDGCGLEAVADLTCVSGTCDGQEGIVLSWTNPPPAEEERLTWIAADGVVIATVRSDATRACIPRANLPGGVYDISVIRCGGAAAVCRPFKTSPEGPIWDDAWLVVGPFLNANDGCDGTGDLLANHIAPTKIECFYPAAGEELPYDPAAPDQGSLGYRGRTGPGGMPPIVPFDDGVGDGFLNLDGHYGDRFNVMAWLVTYVEYTGEPAQVGVCVGSDDSAQVWFNDTLVLNDPSCRFRGGCEAQATVDVEPGVYRIALGVWENAGLWGGQLSLIDLDTQAPIVDDGSGPWRFLGTERPPTARAYPCQGAPGPRFHRGDSDDNGDLEITDALRILSVLFLGGGRIPCDDAADADDNGELDLTDGVLILSVLFLGTGMIPPPGPTLSPCGADPTPDALGCLRYDRCR